MEKSQIIVLEYGELKSILSESEFQRFGGSIPELAAGIICELQYTENGSFLVHENKKHKLTENELFEITSILNSYGNLEEKLL